MLAERSQWEAGERNQRGPPRREPSMAGSTSPGGLMSQPSGMSVASLRGETFTQRMASFVPLISATARRLTFAGPRQKGVMG